MSRASRLAKLEQKISMMEEEFREKLVVALRNCAAGRYGLFGQNERVAGLEGHDRWSTDGRELLHMGEQILQARKEIGDTTDFPLYSRFLEYRSRRGANDLGEPKLAKEFLEELNVKTHV